LHQRPELPGSTLDIGIGREKTTGDGKRMFG
jgi:hypothetical protein